MTPPDALAHLDAIDDPFVELLFDPCWGVILQMGVEPLPPWEPQIELITARLSRELLPDGTDTLRQTLVYGHGFDHQLSIQSAFGEALERVFGGFSRSLEFAGSSDHKILDVRYLPQFSDAELLALGSRYGKANGERFSWYPATNMLTGEPWRVPAQMVFCPYHPIGDEKLFWEPTTTGLAAARSPAAAQTAGLLEVIERDALAVSWALKIPGHELSLAEVLGPEHATLMYALQRGHARLRVSAISLDIPVPVCVAAIYDDASLPAVAFGAGAAVHLRAAAKKALSEAALTRYTMKLRISLLGANLRCDPAQCDPKSYQEHGLAWAAPDIGSQTSWLFAKRSPQYNSVDMSQAAASDVLKYLLAVVQDAGYDTFSCNLSMPELTRGGWAVYRTLVPGLQPLNPGRFRRMLRSQRFQTVLNRISPTRSIVALNDSIHPFC